MSSRGLQDVGGEVTLILARPASRASTHRRPRTSSAPGQAQKEHLETLTRRIWPRWATKQKNKKNLKKCLSTLCPIFFPEFSGTRFVIFCCFFWSSQSESTAEPSVKARWVFKRPNCDKKARIAAPRWQTEAPVDLTPLWVLKQVAACCHLAPTGSWPDQASASKEPPSPRPTTGRPLDSLQTHTTQPLQKRDALRKIVPRVTWKNIHQRICRKTSKLLIREFRNLIAAATRSWVLNSMKEGRPCLFTRLPEATHMKKNTL